MSLAVDGNLQHSVWQPFSVLPAYNHCNAHVLLPVPCLPSVPSRLHTAHPIPPCRAHTARLRRHRGAHLAVLLPESLGQVAVVSSLEHKECGRHVAACMKVRWQRTWSSSRCLSRQNGQGSVRQQHQQLARLTVAVGVLVYD